MGSVRGLGFAWSPSSDVSPLVARCLLPGVLVKHALWHFVHANRRHVGEMLLASLLVNAFVLALPLFSMLVYDKAMGNELHDTLWALAGGMLILFALEIGLRLSRVLIVEHAGARWDAHLDERLMRGILAAPVSKTLAIGDVLSRYREVTGTRDLLSAQFLDRKSVV